MKLTLKTNKFAIVDDLIPEDQFKILWHNVQNEEYNSPHNNNWVKVWRLSEAYCLGSKVYLKSKKPFGNYMDFVSQYMMVAADHVKDLIGEDWADVSFRTYIYQRGTKLPWHNDGHHYKAALTYYVHPFWGSTWGGELMVAEVPNLKDWKHQPKIGPHLDHSWENEYIAEHGIGQWIFPKPNRLVIMPSGVYHSINRIDPDAGDHSRCSVVGFFLKGEIPNEGSEDLCSRKM